MDLKRYPLTEEGTSTLLVRLAEECSEVIKAVCKANRFGLENTHPQEPRTTNAMTIASELRDVTLVWDELVRRKLIPLA